MRCTRFSPGQYIIDSVIISGMLMGGHDICRWPGTEFVRVGRWNWQHRDTAAKHEMVRSV
jgi:hypothetical protein